MSALHDILCEIVKHLPGDGPVALEERIRDHESAGELVEDIRIAAAAAAPDGQADGEQEGATS